MKVTKEMIGAAHDIMLSRGDFVLPSNLIEAIYLAMRTKEPLADREQCERDAARYKWLRTHGLQRAWVSLSTDCCGENFAKFKCEFDVPEPPNLPYEDDECLQWTDADFDAAIDAAMKEN